MSVKSVISALRDKNHKKFLISSHKNLEGDAIGSMMALAELIKALGKEAVVFPPEEMPESYLFLPGVNKVKTNPFNKAKDYDAACIVDCTDIERLGQAQDALYMTRPIINIDHHVSNSIFGTINWIDSAASCSGEQIFELFEKMDIPLTKNAAMHIYAAILTDTGSFRYSNTTERTHQIAAVVLSKGVKGSDIYRRIYEETHKSSLDLLSVALSTLDITKDGKIAWIKVSRAMVKNQKAEIDPTLDFVSFPRSIKGVKIALAFREVGRGLVKVSFRSNEGVDVNKLAKSLGGGGHRAASGCALKGTIGEVEEAVLLKAKKYLKS